MRAVTTILLLALTAPQLPAQEGEWPDGWMSRLDRSNASLDDVSFVVMTPGWHVTTGPATILYDPETTASGSYRVAVDLHMFDPQGRREAFGVFMGGTDLQGPDQAYTYFLIREGGQFLVKRRHGDGTSDVVGWTSHPAIKAFGDRGEGEASVLNRLAVEVGAETCRFLVNDEEVASVPRGDLSLDGVVGLRVNHRVNLHVGSLEVEGM